MNIHAQSVVSKLKECLSYITTYESGKRLLCVYSVYSSKDNTVTNLALLKYKVWTKNESRNYSRNNRDGPEMTDSSQGYLKTYILIKSFFI